MCLSPAFAAFPAVHPKTSFLADPLRLPSRQPPHSRRLSPLLSPTPTRCVGGGAPPPPSSSPPPPPPPRPPGASTPPSSTPPPPPADALRERLEALTLPPRGGIVDYLRSRRPRTRLQYVLLRAPFDAVEGAEEYLRSPLRRMSAATLFLLLGFFSATSAATIIGSVADWDPLAAAVLIVYTEGLTRSYYASPAPSVVLQLANAFKVGLEYGLFVDAFKLST
ncbi:hypothetical protein I4F81_002963 [Pyropia yezoensis]|uniref:Uncharacterized protein n=1 Tax=Pyropia yezoensis TaxID=2788 RepID=A0ACC3BQT4_PYRYE|nr:hypothetical protein I4F81_002963 [Neopyropia yezoensis]